MNEYYAIKGFTFGFETKHYLVMKRRKFWFSKEVYRVYVKDELSALDAFCNASFKAGRLNNG